MRIIYQYASKVYWHFPFDPAIPLSDVYVTDTPAHIQKKVSAEFCITALLVIARVETTRFHPQEQYVVITNKEALFLLTGNGLQNMLLDEKSKVQKKFIPDTTFCIRRLNIYICLKKYRKYARETNNSVYQRQGEREEPGGRGWAEVSSLRVFLFVSFFFLNLANVFSI